MEDKLAKRNQYSLKGALDRSAFYVEKTDDNSVWALKIIRKGNINQSILEREIEFTQKINDTNIIKIYDVFYTENFLNIVFEYCNSGDLKTLIDNARKFNYYFSEKFIKNVLRSICDAFLHMCETINGMEGEKTSLSFVYRELDAKDILISNYSNKFIKISNLERYRFKYDNEMFNCEGIHYVPPERLNSETCNIKTVVWSVGKI
jgi:serine/threonine protein kinase